jgi:hypothetical protein
MHLIMASNSSIPVVDLVAVKRTPKHPSPSMRMAVPRATTMGKTVERALSLTLHRETTLPIAWISRPWP